MDPATLSTLIYAGLGVVGTIVAHRFGVSVPGLPAAAPTAQPGVPAANPVVAPTSPVVQPAPVVVTPAIPQGAAALEAGLTYLHQIQAGLVIPTSMDKAVLASMLPIVTSLVPAPAPAVVAAAK